MVFPPKTGSVEGINQSQQHQLFPFFVFLIKLLSDCNGITFHSCFVKN